MHLTRAQSSRKLPVKRKGTKYIARALSHKNESVPVVVAVRDILKLAGTAREVKYMIQKKLLKINGKEVKDMKESIRIFNIFTAGGKNYRLSILPSKRFFLSETNESKRVVKVVGKTLLKNGAVQLNLHDGTNILEKEKTRINDSLEIDFSGKIVGKIAFEKGKNAFVFSGKSAGKFGKLEEVNGGKAKIKLEEKTVELNKSHLIVTG